MPLSASAVLLFDTSAGVAEVNDAGASVVLSGSPIALFRFAPAGFGLNNMVVLGVQTSTTGPTTDRGRVISWDVATGAQTVVGTAYTTATTGTHATVVATDKTTGKILVIPVSSTRAALAGTTAVWYDPSDNSATSIPVVQNGARYAEFSHDGTKCAVAYLSYSGGTLPTEALRIYNTADWSEVVIPDPSTWDAALAAVTQCSTATWSSDDSYMGFGFGPHNRVYITPYGSWSSPVLNQSRGASDNYQFIWTPDDAHVAELYFSGGASNVTIRTFPALVTARTFDAGAGDQQLAFLPDSDEVVIGRDTNVIYAGGQSFASTILSGITLRSYVTTNAKVYTVAAPIVPPVTEAFWTSKVKTQETI